MEEIIELPEEQSQVGMSVPLFVKKLWNMVNDTNSEDIISWNSTGDGFIIQDQLKFITELLPHYFKHNNMASFVRQLNFYNFHKISNVNDEIQFGHSCFLKDVPQVLVFIRRKNPVVKQKLPSNVKEQEVIDLLNDVKEIKSKHSRIDKEMTLLKQDNAALWNELNSLRMKYDKQSSIINRLIHFLISYIHSHHQTTFSKQNIRVSRDRTLNNLKSVPSLLQLDYQNQKGSGTKSYSGVKPGPSETITYSLKFPQSHLENNGKTILPNSSTFPKKNQQSLKQILALNKPVRRIGMKAKNSDSSGITYSVKLPGNQSRKIVQPDVHNKLLEILEENEKLFIENSLEEMLTEIQTDDGKCTNSPESDIHMSQSITETAEVNSGANTSQKMKSFVVPETNYIVEYPDNSDDTGINIEGVRSNKDDNYFGNECFTSNDSSVDSISSSMHQSGDVNQQIVTKNGSHRKKRIQSDVIFGDVKCPKKTKKSPHEIIAPHLIQTSGTLTRRVVQPEVQNSLFEILKENQLSDGSDLDKILSEIQSESETLVGTNYEKKKQVSKVPSSIGTTTYEINHEDRIKQCAPTKTISETLPIVECPPEETSDRHSTIDIAELNFDITEPSSAGNSPLNIMEVPEIDINELPDINLPIVESPSNEIASSDSSIKDFMKCSILENPKQNLSLYLNNTQDELNMLQDLFNNLNSKEFGNILGNADFSLDQNFDADLEADKDEVGADSSVNKSIQDNNALTEFSSDYNLASTSNVSVDDFFNPHFMSTEDVQ
ncbi:hypothetical protein JTB14_029562 [Gonioctena quinquepunctata]|nr:hypothetical protein JTB14_029562 [Gonioctena quinquepunctata]